MVSNQASIGRLETVAIRNVFAKEAQHFTTWLEQHIDALCERLGVELTVVQREKEVGEFNVDLLCEDGDGHPVIIENQLDRTDHDHLGKLLTYLVNLEASTAVWITPEPRPEHQRVIDWLNESTSEDISFYLVRVEAVRIGESPFAPLFTVLAGPDTQAKKTGEAKKGWAERHHLRQQFWTELLEKSRERTKIFSNISPGRGHWIATGAGKSGISFVYVILQECGRVELYIDHDHETGVKSKKIFDALYAEKSEIEEDFADTLEWERLDDKHACRISKRFANGGLNQPDTWPQLQDEMIQAMIRLDHALRGRLVKISV